MGKPFLKIAAFVVALNLALVYVGYTITRVSGRKGGLEVALTEVSPEAGEKTFWGKGRCFTCHSIGNKGSGFRGPNLGVLPPKFPEPIAIRAAARKPDMGFVEYMVESVLNPSAYIVEGYSDGVMPHVWEPPISLTDEEIRSALVYLVSLSRELEGETINAIARAQKPYQTGQIMVKGPSKGFAVPEGDHEDGRDVYVEMKCFSCHKIEGEEFPVLKENEGGVGPDLTGIGTIQTPTYLFESIVSPTAINVTGEGFLDEEGLSIMPEFHDTMTLRQLADVVAYLSSLGREVEEPEEEEEREKAQ